jgi:site-specific recombinase XerC
MDAIKSKRDRALFAVLLSAGLRRSEAAQLSLAQLQKREDRWVIVDLLGKHDRIRSVPIPIWTKQAIDEWIAAADLRPAGRQFARGLQRRGGFVQQVVRTGAGGER